MPKEQSINQGAIRPERDPFPSLIVPMKPAETNSFPRDLRQWVAEPKFNGIRALIHVREDSISIRSGSGKVITASFPEITEEFREIARTFEVFIIDGEIITGAGRENNEKDLVVNRLRMNPVSTRFDMLQNPCCFMAFDILYSVGNDSRKLAQKERRMLLEYLLDHSESSENFIRLTPQQKIKIRDYSLGAKLVGLEGIVLKRKDALYRSGVTHNWLKIKFK